MSNKLPLAESPLHAMASHVEGRTLSPARRQRPPGWSEGNCVMNHRLGLGTLWNTCNPALRQLLVVCALAILAFTSLTIAGVGPAGTAFGSASGACGATSAACTANGSGPAQALPVDPATLVQRLYDARSAGDLDAELALLTPDATYESAGAPICNFVVPCQGQTAISALLRNDLTNHANFTITNIGAFGSTVIGTFEARSDRIRASGAERVLNTFLAQVPNDRISALVVLLDTHDPQTIAFINYVDAMQQAVQAAP